MSVYKRLTKVCNWLIFNEVAENHTDLARLIEYTKSSFSQIINGKVPLSDKFIDKLCELDRNINKVWVKSGDGNMFLEPEPDLIAEPKVPYEKMGDKELWAELLRSKNETIRNLEEHIRQLKSGRD